MWDFGWMAQLCDACQEKKKEKLVSHANESTPADGEYIGVDTDMVSER